MFTFPVAIYAGSSASAVTLAADVTATIAIAGNLSVSKPLAGAISATAGVTGEATLTKPIAGAIATSSTVTGDLGITKPLAGSISVTAVVEGNFFNTQSLEGAIAASASVAGDISLTKPLAADVTASVSLSGSMAATKPLTGNVAIAAAVTGDLTVPLQALSFTASQSSTFGGATGTQSNLTDNLVTSGAGTNTAALSWIALDLGAAYTIQGFVVAAGSLTGFGATSTYLNSAPLRSSTDNSSWTTQATVSGMSDTLNSSALFKYVSVGGVSARYWRLERTSNYVATTEFQPVGSQSFSYPQTLTYQSNGDTNGVFYYLGYSTFDSIRSAWSNPAVLGNVTVTASATVSTGNVYNLSDRNNSTVILTATSAGQTITVNFGSGRSFRLDRYTLRTSTNTNGYPRNWNMRGSTDGSSYTNIDVRSADTTANAASTIFSYTCNQSNTNSYQYIQFQLNGTNSGGNNVIDLSEWEFYGVLS